MSSNYNSTSQVAITASCEPCTADHSKGDDDQTVAALGSGSRGYGSWFNDGDDTRITSQTSAFPALEREV